MRARYYDPESGRFISKDPIGLAGGINMYVYAINNPLTYIDPSGHISAKGLAGTIVLAVGAATKNPVFIVIGGGLLIWDVIESVQRSKAKGKELGEQLEIRDKPKRDRIKELMEDKPQSKWNPFSYCSSRRL